MSLDAIRGVLEQEASAIQALASRLDEPYAMAVDWIVACQGRVATCGIGKSGRIAEKMSATLASTGTPSFFLHAAEAVHGDLGMIAAGDVVIAYSYSGETDEIVRLFPSFSNQGARTILLTGNPESSAGRQADLVLNVRVESEACPNNLAPTTSTTVMLAVSDALAVAAMRSRGFGKDEFAKFHPAGALGKRLLLRVADVMRPSNEIATVALGDPALTVIREMTGAHVGAACVVDDDRLLGLVSESDLRRNLLDRPNPLTTPAEAMMNPKPTTVSPDLLAMEALEVFQNFPVKIGELPVTQDGRLVGLLVLKDLLRSGIV